MNRKNILAPLALSLFLVGCANAADAKPTISPADTGSGDTPATSPANRSLDGKSIETSPNQNPSQPKKEEPSNPEQPAAEATSTPEPPTTTPIDAPTPTVDTRPTKEVLPGGYFQVINDGSSDGNYAMTINPKAFPKGKLLLASRMDSPNLQNRLRAQQLPGADPLTIVNNLSGQFAESLSCPASGCIDGTGYLIFNPDTRQVIGKIKYVINENGIVTDFETEGDIAGTIENHTMDENKPMQTRTVGLFTPNGKPFGIMTVNSFVINNIPTDGSCNVDTMSGCYPNGKSPEQKRQAANLNQLDIKYASALSNTPVKQLSSIPGSRSLSTKYWESTGLDRQTAMKVTKAMRTAKSNKA